MKLKDMKVWPKNEPKSKSLEKKYLIFEPSIGYKITRYSDNNGKEKTPYFYWCGNLKKVWWIELEGK